MSYEEDGARHSIYFLEAKTRDDLRRRIRRAPQDRRDDLRAASAARPTMSRASSPAWRPIRRSSPRRPRAASNSPTTSCAITAYARQRHLRRLCRAAAAGGAQSRVLLSARTCRSRPCAWCARTTTAWSISGMKMLATGAVFSNEVWVGNLLPLAPEPVEGGDHLRRAVQRAGAARSGRASRSSARPRTSSTARSPGASTRPTRW